jgi:hypothetical protein
MEHVGKLYGHLEYFTSIWYILWTFSYFVADWYILPRLGILCQEKSGNPAFCLLAVQFWYISIHIVSLIIPFMYIHIRLERKFAFEKEDRNCFQTKEIVHLFTNYLSLSTSSQSYDF